MDLHKTLEYLAARAIEPSSAAGVGVVLAGLGAQLPAGLVQYALLAVGGVLGVAAFFVPEKK
jgi:hypothetical protein